MASHKVEIAIRARDEASKKLLRIGKAAFGMGSLLKKAAAAAAFYFGGRAIYRFTKSTVEAAAQQEEAHALLIQSLKNVGAQYDVIFPRLKQFSSEVQQVTRFGDEEVQQLMSLGLNLGLTTDKLEEATKGAIGLRSIMGGKLGLTESMKYLALAYQGEFTMLRRYIPELRKTEDATEQLAIVQQKGIEGFKLAREEALRGLGPLIQMRNAIGDVKEKIGAALLPTVQESALRIKEWAERNQNKIGEWAEKSVATVKLVNDSFIDFVKYMKTDWKEGLSFALDVAMAGFKAWGKSMMVMMEKITSDFYNNIGVWVHRAAARKFDFSEFYAEYLNIWRRKTGAWLPARGDKTFQKEAEEYAHKQMARLEKEGWYQARFPMKEMMGWKDVYNETKQIYKDMLKDIMAGAPGPLKDTGQARWDQYQKTMAEITGRYAAGVGGYSPFGTGAAGGAGGTLAELAAAVQGRLAPRESRFLTFAPGQKLDPVERNTREQVELAKEQTYLARRLLSIGEKIMVSLSPAAVPPANAMTLRAARLYK